MGQSNKSAVDYWRTEDGLTLLECWTRDGIKLREIAEFIGITQPLLSRWRREYPEIDEALSKGKELCDYKVENALLKSALGFTTTEITVTVGHRQINGQWVDITKETKTKEIAPNVTACLAWLNNRKPDIWKKNRDNVVELDDEESDVKITIVRGKNNELEDNVNNETSIDQKDIKKAQKKLKEEDPWEGWENW